MILHRIHLVFLGSVLRSLVTASVVPSSPILVALMKQALSSFETSVITRTTGVTSQKTPFFTFYTVWWMYLYRLLIKRNCPKMQTFLLLRMVSSGLLRRVALVALTRATWRNNPEDTILHSHRRENLKSYIPVIIYLDIWIDRLIMLFIELQCRQRNMIPCPICITLQHENQKRRPLLDNGALKKRRYH
jgi:hypothetical protein